MPRTTSLTSKYRLSDRVLLTPEDLKELYLYGIELSPENGVYYPDESVAFFIDKATEEVEEYLAIKINEQLYTENLFFQRTDWENWGYIPTTYPVNDVKSLTGFVGTLRQVEYPVQWLTSKRASDGKLHHRRINIVPNYNSRISHNIVYKGIIPHLGYAAYQKIPDYWEVKYCTGFKKVPADILDVIGKLASLSYLNIAGDLVIGAGIASESISADGLSQNINTTQSAENSAFSARIKQYQKELKDELPRMKDFYRGFMFGAM